MNDVLAQPVAWVRDCPGIALAAAAGAYLLLFLLVLWILFRYIRMARRQSRLFRGAEGTNIERMLMEHLSDIEATRTRISEAADRGVSNETAIQQCLQKVGLVRFDAFGDVGGEQSFALALLDAADNGLVVSGLFSRHDMRVYAKPVVAGNSPLTLTDEEREAITASRVGGPSPNARARRRS